VVQQQGQHGAARACERLGDRDGARTHLTAALALFTERNLGRWL